jgi:iron complex outermembrane receptor protein
MFLSTSVRLAPRHARARSAARRFIVISFGAVCTGALAQSGEPAALHLQDVSVSATRFAERAADLPFGVSVLTAADIRASGVTTVNEAIIKLLGVPGRLDLSGGDNYGLDLRGFGATADSNQVVVVDGIRVSEADQSSPRLDAIPIDTVERIEVIRGSGAVLYGEGATAGVIVITTKAGSGAARQNRAELYAAAGSYGLREGRGTGTLVAGDFSLDVAANKRNADNHRDNFRSRNDGASLAGQWRNEWLRVGVRHATDHLDSGLPGALTTAQYQADPHQASTPLDSGSIRNHSSSVFGQAVLGAWQIGVDAGRRAKSLTSTFSGFVYAYDVDASSYALRARYADTYGAVSNSLVTGIDHEAWQRTVQGALGPVANEHAQAYYLKDELKLAGGTGLSGGWRTARITKEDSEVTANIDQRPNAWEIGVVQPLAAGVAVFGRIGHSFRLANADEFNFTTPGLTLKPQVSRDTELGARWAHADGRVELRLYRSALTDEIGYDPNAIGPYGNGANVNFDPTRHEGVELEGTQALGGGVTVHLNAAARRARFTSGPYAGHDLPLTPRHTYALRADWSPAPGHRIDAGVNYVSTQSPDFDNACRMPGYTTADLRYAYRWRTAELALGVNNLADAKYYTQAFACVNGAVSSIYPEAGRAVTASLRLDF